MRHDRFYLIHIQQKPVGGHEDKGLRQLLSGIFVKFHNTLVQPRFIVAVQRQMPFVTPVAQLVDNGIIQILINLHIGALLRVDIGGTELARTVAAVHRLQVDHHRMRRLLPAVEIVDIFLLLPPSRHKLQLQIAFTG